MSLKEILDPAKKFRVMQAKEDGWSAVDWASSCAQRYKHLHCCHVMMVARMWGMVLDIKVSVAILATEITEPSLRKPPQG
jgi:hypothetical protein